MSAPRPSLVTLPAIAAALLLTACHSAPDLTAWRATHEGASGAAPQGSLTDGLAAMDELRLQDLASARTAALALVALHPEDGRALLAASRAESDYVLLQPAPPESDRDLALHSALDYAERAVARSPEDAAVLGQHAWALGATTHLEPMFSRAGHARRTEEACNRALALEEDQREALRTLATLRLRLATLPWIARVMAIGEPEGSLDEALRLAVRSNRLQPDRESHLLVAKVLTAMERYEEARTTLNTALVQPVRFPRDRELVVPIQEALAALPGAPEGD